MATGDLTLLALTALLGALMSRTSLCTVAAVQHCVRERSGQALRPMLAATSAAGLVLLLGHLLAPGAVALPVGHVLGWPLAIGAVLLGAGALVNGACYLGSVQYLGRGNANFLFTLLGLWLAARAAVGMPSSAAGGMAMAALLPGVALFAAGLAFALVLRKATLAAAAVGACAGVVYASHPAWSYGALLESIGGAGHGMSTGMPAGMGTAVASAALLFAGCAAGALLQHRWQFVRPQPRRAARCLAGGFVMGTGAHLIPGGNDMLLLWAIPGLAAYGAVAYALMAASIGVTVWAGGQRGN